jgi:hypothetical protein
MNTSEVIKQAIFNMGGPTLAANKLQVSTNTVHKWVRNGVIPNLDIATQVSAASGFNVSILRPCYEQQAEV